jgi:hypothetical protein
MSLREDERPAGYVLFALPRRCPGCAEVLEHTGDKLFYCLACCNFFIELEGKIEHYLVNPPETGRRERLITSPSPA